jgi:predicted lipid-binding transport protein (Tim44 family)
MTARRTPSSLAARALAALASGVLLLVLLAPAAMAAAGGGSSGFSGGGGGGGGGYSGGGGGGYGSGSGSSGPVDIVFGALILLALICFVLYWIYRQAVNAFVAQRLRIRRGKRVKRVETAAAEAAEDDAAFAADAVRVGADQLFRQVQAAWSANDVATLDKLVGNDLMVEWRRRLEDFKRKKWQNIVEVLGTVGVEYVGLVNRLDDTDDRCVVRIEARLRDYVLDSTNGRKINRTGSSSEFTTLREYWTLGKRDDGSWRLLSIEQDKEGAHHIDEAIVASPWGDDQRLRDEALVEGAVADKVVDGYKISEIADLDFSGDARAAALDLSLADARFMPDVLETAARRAVGGWAEAVDGEDDELLAVATPDALRDLLYPGGTMNRRLVVRGPRIERVEIAELDAGVDPATMTIEVTVRGRRYIQDRDTAAIVSGSDSQETTFTERWLMAISGDDRNPWRIVDATAPRDRVGS